MKKKNKYLEEMLHKMVDDFNSYSELVALNYEKKREGKCDESTLQWNRGCLNKIEEYLKEFAAALDVGLKFDCGEHTFGYDDWKRQLEYRTVTILEPNRGVGGMASWEKEKAYCEKKAAELSEEMKSAIETSDRKRFEAAFSKAQRYMKKKQLTQLLKAFYERVK